MSNPILKVEKLAKKFYVKRSIFQKSDAVNAVNGVDFEVLEGTIFGLVGESGCGKTTIARCLVGLERPTSGNISFRGEEIGSLSQKDFRPYRKKIQIVYQDPSDSLNPRLTVSQTIMEPLNLYSGLPKADQQKLVMETMEIVGLRTQHLERFPHQLSTGQQQRVGIARAIICHPDFVVLDEPTSALDLSVRGRVLELLLDIQRRSNLTYIFISHDLGVVRFICQHTAVMYLGYIAESGPTKELFNNPEHPYTKALISAIPKVHAGSRKERIILQGEVPSPINMPPGCPFSNRCLEAEEICSEKRPKLLPTSEGRMVSCHMVQREDDSFLAKTS